MSAKATPESFYRRVEKDGDCLVFVGHRNHDGYGRLRYHGKLVMAHRLAWAIIRGPIPTGYEIDHICKNRACVNILHLQSITGHQHTVQSNQERWGVFHKHSGPEHEIRRTRAGHPYCISCRRKKYRLNN
jgi:HNH endonuclease